MESVEQVQDLKGDNKSAEKGLTNDESDISTENKKETHTTTTEEESQKEPHKLEAAVEEAIIDNILSPPKSESTSSSSPPSTGSDSQLSPTINTTDATNNTLMQPVSEPINTVLNGSMPKSLGKPMNIKKKLNKPRQRKPKAFVPMYESEVTKCLFSTLE